MKKIISLALVLMMAMLCLTACGEELVAPEGTFASDSGTYTAVFSDYNAEENTGKLSITFSVMDMPEVVSGTFSVAVNDPDAGTYFVDFTPDGGELIESFMIFDPAQQVVGQYADVGEIGGNGITYYAAPAEEAAPEAAPAE